MPLALRKTPGNPLCLPAAASVKMPDALGGGMSTGRRRAKVEASPYVRGEAVPARFMKLEGQARLDAAVPALRVALELLSRPDGWCQGAMHDDAGRVSLNGALHCAEPLEAFFAREVLRRVLCENDFTRWNDAPLRRRSDVVRAVRAALAECTRHVSRGGWRVSR